MTIKVSYNLSNNVYTYPLRDTNTHFLIQNRLLSHSILMNPQNEA